MIRRLGFFKKTTFLFFGAILIFSQAEGQQFQTVNITGSLANTSTHDHSEKCGHGILEAKLENEMGYFGSKSFFESWVDQKIEARSNQPQILAKTQAEVRLIPVVVHVIHNGQSEGTGSNVSLSQIEAQIRVLNEDFNRQNSDVNRTPAEFLPVAGDANIQFVLAKQDPFGLPTNGVVRIQGPNATYSPNDATLIGQLSQWDPSTYMNMWVVPLVQPFIGYASFPVSNLPGLNFPVTTTITDGVTIDYRFFGIDGSSISASLGRTATHEVGHYLGLRHIWGDGGCGVDDFVADTPLQDNSNNICNASPSRISCGSNDMIQNYMDYTPDVCMNLFTVGQIERFNIVLANSPRRISLVNNRATVAPVLADIDLAISRIIQPTEFACGTTVNPRIELLNAGNNLLTSGRVELRQNGNLLESKRFTFSLGTGQSVAVIFNSFNLVSGTNTIEYKVTQANDQADSNPDNSTRSINPILQPTIALPYTYSFGNFPSPWTITNPDEGFGWERTSLPISGQTQDLIYIRNYEYEGPGQLDYFISPIINLSENPNAQLVFEVAHSPYDQPGFQDRLIVAVSQDCGNTFDIANATYSKGGFRLETSPSTLDEFIPFNNDQFRTEIVNLAPFASLGSVRIALINENSFGNNIYVKNLRILPTEELNYEIKIEDLIAPSPVSDGTHENEIIRLRNTGNLPISEFLFSRSTNGSPLQTFVAGGNAVNSGRTVNLTTDNSTTDGLNKLDFRIFEPNFDQNSGNSDSYTAYTLEDRSTTIVPWRQNFNNSSQLNPWLTINPQNNSTAWTNTSIANGSGPNNAARVLTLANGNSYWLASPIFDLTVSRQASIFFDYAVGQVSPGTRLKVLASDDAGETYSEVWSATGAELSTTAVGEANPNNANDYVRKYVNLTDFAGEGKKQVRIAFVLEGGTVIDSPLFLDNVELFLNANPNPVIPAEGMTVLYPNPATDIFNLAFNLPRLENVTIQVISTSGAVVQEIKYPNTLNQTYSFSTSLFSPGVFIIKITSDTIRDTRRLIIN
jgi:hypothetical protein